MQKILNQTIKAYNQEEKIKDKTYPISREVLNNSKRSISKVHYNEMDKAKEYLVKAKKNIQKLKKYFQEYSKNKYEGYIKEGLEEYVEAELFYSYFKDKKASLSQEVLTLLKDEPEILIGGFSDFTGEISRKAVIIASKENVTKLQAMSKTINEVIDKLLKISLKGQSRHKFDQAKRNAKNLEMMLYEIRIRG
jgi:translin